MRAIIPAILPASRRELEEKLERLHGITDEVQIDMVDGRFAEPATWPYGTTHKEGETVAQLESFRFEVDLMVEEPERALAHWVGLGAARITVHAETTRRLQQVIEEFDRTYGHDKTFTPGLIELGLALNIATDTALIEPFLDRCNYVQFMGIARIGKQHEPFDTRVLSKVAAFHRKYPDMPIQVDGGVSLETAPRLLEAGVSRLVIGSALWGAADLGKAVEAFNELMQTRGLYA